MSCIQFSVQQQNFKGSLGKKGIFFAAGFVFLSDHISRQVHYKCLFLLHLASAYFMLRADEDRTRPSILFSPQYDAATSIICCRCRRTIFTRAVYYKQQHFSEICLRTGPVFKAYVLIGQMASTWLISQINSTLPQPQHLGLECR